MSSVLITREPVINKQRAITANRLIVHAADIASAVETLSSFEDDWPSEHLVFLSLGKLIPTPELASWQIPSNVLVEIPAQTLAHKQTEALMLELNQNGVPMCLTWYQPGAPWPEEYECRFSIADYRKVLHVDEAPGLSLAWGLNDMNGFEDALIDGYDGAAGWFFLNGAPTTKELSTSHAQIVRLLNLVRQNAETREIETALKQDVTLSYKLLRYINSVGFGLMAEVQSFRHAVAILGMDKLNKWLSLLLVSANKNASTPAVMQAALARGRFMEILGTHFFDKNELDNLFITGAFSLLHVLLGTELDAVLDNMHLPASILDALLRNEGVYAPMLKLAIATEGFSANALATQAEQLGIAPEQVSKSLIQALAFADRLQLS